ncbi:MAG: IPT/TIG domain-containing protein [Anaerolineae bacterium]|nr:IPT/TIG domain-containing protein [Anaerolineae bacterium]
MFIWLALDAVALASPPMQLAVTTVEPSTLSTSTGGILSVYGSGFSAASTVRLIGYGLLDTEFVNGTALRATVPAGLPAGTYDLQISDGGSSVTRAKAIQLVPPPTPTPEPTTAAAPVAGQPHLTVRNYAIQPTQVKAGQDFMVTLYIYNDGSRASENTLVVFPGGAFLPLGETGHQLWQLHINATAVVTQMLRAPSTIATGVQNIQVNLSGNDFQGNHYEFPQTLSVEVLGAPTYTASAPRLIVESAETSPAVVAPGDAFTLTLGLSNRGSRRATNVTVGTGDTLVIPTQGGNVSPVGTIKINEIITIEIPLTLAQVESGGRRSLALAFQYNDYEGNSYNEQQSVGINIDTGLVGRPKLAISSYAVEPADLFPGSHFTLTLTLTNQGERSATDVTVGVGGTLALPGESSSTAFVDALGPGGEQAVIFALVLGEVDKAGRQAVPIDLKYSDPAGTKYTEQQSIGVDVNTGSIYQPQLLIESYTIEPTQLSSGDRFTLSLKLTNVGGGKAQRILIILGGEGAEQLDAFVPAAASNIGFLAELEAGASTEIAQAMIVDAKAEPKAYSVPIGLTYNDAYGNRKSETHRISLMVLRRPEFQVSFYMPIPGPAMTGMPFMLPVEVMNAGTSRISISLLELTSEQLQIEGGSMFVGGLEPGLSWTVDATAIAMEAGSAQVVINIHYLDDFNQKQVISHTLEVEIMEGSDPNIFEPEQVMPEQPQTIWQQVLRFLRGLVGLGS